MLIFNNHYNTAVAQTKDTPTVQHIQQNNNSSSRTQDIPHGLQSKIDGLSKAMFYEMFDYKQSLSDTYHEDGNYEKPAQTGDFFLYHTHTDDGYVKNMAYIVGDYKYVFSQEKTDTMSHMVYAHSYRGLIGEAMFEKEQSTAARYRAFLSDSFLEEEPVSTDTKILQSQNMGTFPTELHIQSDKGYNFDDVLNNLNKIESLLDEHLIAEYKKDPDSMETTKLLFLKAKLQSLPDSLNMFAQWANQDIKIELSSLKNPEKQDEEYINIAIKGIENTLKDNKQYWANEMRLLTEFSLNLKEYLPEAQQKELVDSLNTILNFADHRTDEMLVYHAYKEQFYKAKIISHTQIQNIAHNVSVNNLKNTYQYWYPSRQ